MEARECWAGGCCAGRQQSDRCQAGAECTSAPTPLIGLWWQSPDAHLEPFLVLGTLCVSSVLCPSQALRSSQAPVRAASTSPALPQTQRPPVLSPSSPAAPRACPQHCPDQGRGPPLSCPQSSRHSCSWLTSVLPVLQVHTPSASWAAPALQSTEGSLLSSAVPGTAPPTCGLAILTSGS